jgi:hypothetical protein
MRWTDKPRKKTRKEVILEYIKFLKIMGYYKNVVSYMYRLARLKSGYVNLSNDKGGNSIHNIDVVLHNRCMIKYFEAFLRYTHKLEKWRIKETFVIYPLSLEYKDSTDVSNLLWSYFEEKHIANCILVD